MKRFKQKTTALAIMLIVLNGCASGNLSKTSNIKNNIYAQLTETKNGYRFTNFKITNKPADLYGPWVNLKTNTPMWDNSERSCLSSALKSMDTCKNENDEINNSLFMDISLNKGMIIAEIIAAPITLGLSLLDFEKKVTFNHEKYKSALSEGWEYITHDELLDIDKSLTLEKNYIMITKEQTKNIDHISKKYLKTKIVDNSGLYKENNTVFGRLLAVNPINYIEAKGDSIAMLKDESKKKIFKNIEKNEFKINVICSNHTDQAFNMTINCPKNFIPFQDNEIIVQVNSANLYDVRVKEITGSDNNLNIQIADRILKIENKTNKYIKLNTISIYHGDKIKTISDIDLEIAPNSQLSKSSQIIYGTKHNIRWDSLTYKNITLNSAKNINVNAGIAAKYTTTNKTKEHTLFNKTNHKLINLI